MTQLSYRKAYQFVHPQEVADIVRVGMLDDINPILGPLILQRDHRKAEWLPSRDIKYGIMDHFGKSLNPMLRSYAAGGESQRWP